MSETHYPIELNGAPAQLDDLRALVQMNYGHFTAMQVRDGAVRGLDLHLDRLEHATHALFGVALDRERLRECLRHAVGPSAAPLSLRVNVFSRAFRRERPVAPAEPDILVTVGPPAPASPEPLRVQSFRYARELPQTKHVGTFPLFHYRRLAQQGGFDDALFVDQDGVLSEGSIWNLGFADRDGIVWPEAPQLPGISLQLLKAGLARAGIADATRPVTLADLGRYRAAFFTNSSAPVRLIVAIDDARFALDRTLEAQLVAAYESTPLQRL